MIPTQTWFEAKIQYDKIGTEDGKQKKVTDTYLVDAVSFTEAESRIIEVVRPYMTGDFTVASIKRKKYYEVVEENVSISAVDAEAAKIFGSNSNQSSTADKWFDCKINFVILDQEKGSEKKISAMMLVNANSVNSANDTLFEHMKGTMSDWELVKIAETPILDVVPYSAN